GLSKGKYMWVSNDYIINSKSEINLIVNLRSVAPGKSIIKFRITNRGRFINDEDIEVEIE
ncbi:MAG: hypothetical protein MUO60_00335, partial [Clostridiaceae bacterium]|nr:hypothetical protein [Clostridiaceae bacterium]